MEVKERQINELVPADYNPRTLSEKQFEEIKKSLTKFGFVDPVLINIHKSRKDVIIGGHQRTKVWESMGNDTVPCVELSLTLKKEKELNVRLNKNSGSWDFDMLANHFDQDELMEWGFEEFDFGLDETDSEQKSEGEIDVDNFQENAEIKFKFDNQEVYFKTVDILKEIVEAKGFENKEEVLLYLLDEYATS